MTPSSPWKQTLPRPPFPALDANIETDVAIIGGGIVGVTTAYELAKAGVRVVLLEQDEIGSGSSGWTTAFVTQVIDTPFSALKKNFGEKEAKQVWNNGRDAITELQRIIAAETIDCEFASCPAYIYSDGLGLEQLIKEGKAIDADGTAANFTTTSLGFASQGHLQVSDQAKFNSLKFLNALAARAVELGAKIFEHSKAIGFSQDTIDVVKTKDGQVSAKQVVLASEMPLGDIDGIVKRIKVNQTYALEAELPNETIPEAIYWDTQKPYHYFRVDKLAGHDRIILGGEDKPMGQSGDATERFANLKKFLNELLPGIDIKVVREWSGRILETEDGLPFIGRSKTNENIFYATGFAGNGMTFGVLSAMLIRDLILGKDNSAAALYRPDRHQ